MYPAKPVIDYVRPMVDKYCVGVDVAIDISFRDMDPDVPVDGAVKVLNDRVYMSINVGHGAKLEDIKAAASHEIAHILRRNSPAVHDENLDDYTVEEVYTWKRGIDIARENNVLSTYCKHARLELEEIYGLSASEEIDLMISEIYRVCG